MAEHPIFNLPLPSPKRTAAIEAANKYIEQQMARRVDARDILKGLISIHEATVSFPSYRTALRCGDIYTEAAAHCALATAKLLLSLWKSKAQEYLDGARAGDLFSLPARNLVAA
jgi:hypothetical protein